MCEQTVWENFNSMKHLQMYIGLCRTNHFVINLTNANCYTMKNLTRNTAYSIMCRIKKPEVTKSYQNNWPAKMSHQTHITAHTTWQDDYFKIRRWFPVPWWNLCHDSVCTQMNNVANNVAIKRMSTESKQKTLIQNFSIKQIKILYKDVERPITNF